MESGRLNIAGSDINRLQTFILPSLVDPDSSTCGSRDPRLATVAWAEINVSDQTSERFAQPHDSLSQLPSVVDESAQQTNLESQCLEIARHLSPNVAKQLGKMNSQYDLANGTQLLSQSVYESILKKRRSRKDDPQDPSPDSQRTYEEGDTGHVDITSSFVTGHEQLDNMEDSEPVEFSPVATQYQLTQYAESQRFKTPATAGRKRTYNGDIVDTPVPVGNPLARGAEMTPGRMLGLSQAFAATQAASSPFSNGLLTGPRSDRPSPNIDLQDRMTTGVSSSPLRPISEFRRSATEPASRYVPMKYSQAERERIERMRLLEDAAGNDASDDDFDDEPSIVLRRRRQRERERQAKEELKSLSSPILSSKGPPFSSPIIPHLQNLDTEDSTETPFTASASAPVADRTDEREAEFDLAHEGETEDLDQVDVQRSSQLPTSGEEDKENRLVLVPKTGPRLRPEKGFTNSEIEASPSIRYAPRFDVEPLPELPSSEPVRIMDSQPVQNTTRTRQFATTNMNSAPDRLTLVKDAHIDENNPVIFDGSQPQLVVRPSPLSAAAEVRSDEEESSRSSPPVNYSTHEKSVPETVSELRAGKPDSASATDQQTIDRPSVADGSTNFDTAKTHIESGSKFSSSQMSEPVHATPPGRRRRRMLEIGAEPSPQGFRSQPSFDAGAVLELDIDQHVASLLESSPLRSGHIDRRDHLSHPGPDDAMTGISSPVEKVRPEEQAYESADASLESGTGAPEASQDIVKPGRHNRLGRPSGTLKTRRKTPELPPPTSRASIFDIQASPAKEVRLPQPVLRKPVLVKTSDVTNNPRKLGRQESRMEKRLKPDLVEEVLPALASTTSPDLQIQSDNPHPQSDVSEISVSTDVTTDNVVAPDMVFAYYKGDPRGYYPARLIGNSNNGGYQIQWDGYEPEEVDSYAVKALDLRIGDAVKVLAEGFKKIPYVIRGFKNKVEGRSNSITDVRGHEVVVLAQKQRKSLPGDVSLGAQREVPIVSVYLDTNMWAQMKPRNLEFRPNAEAVTLSGISTPIDRAGTPSTPSSRGRRQTRIVNIIPEPADGIFSNMAFAVSYDDPSRKNLVSNLIQINGGLLLHDSFHELLEPGAVHLKSQYVDVGFTALLTDRHSRKEKYMQALALGLPCLSGRWVEACAKSKCLVDWQSYLLPAGESIELDNFTRSRVMPSIDFTSVKMLDMLNSRPKLLDNAAAIIVVGRGKSEVKRTPYVFLLQALGARRVQKVPDVKAVKDLLDSKGSEDYGWVFVDDKDVSTAKDVLNIESEPGPKDKTKRNGKRIEKRYECKIAGNELIVQSLILGRLYEG